HDAATRVGRDRPLVHLQSRRARKDRTGNRNIEHPPPDESRVQRFMSGSAARHHADLASSRHGPANVAGLWNVADQIWEADFQALQRVRYHLIRTVDDVTPHHPPRSLQLMHSDDRESTGAPRESGISS